MNLTFFKKHSVLINNEKTEMLIIVQLESSEIVRSYP
jgi:hypothetical protein